jgi:site-specific DNA recombinase
VYARVSTERQTEQQTITQQLDRLRAYAQERGWTLDEAHVYCDESYSGASLNRPALDRLRDGVARGEVDVLLLTSPDRLARRYAYQVWLLEAFEQAGCTVIFLDRPPSGDPQDALLLQIRGAVAEYERTLIADRMRRGRLAKLQSGQLLPWSRAPYGYRLDPHHPRDPAGVRVDEEQAIVVRQMFTWYGEEGLTLRALGRRLIAAHIPSPSGSDHWNTSSVRKLLTNHAYRGIAYGNQQEMVPAKRRRPLLKPASVDGTGRSCRRRAPEEWIGVAVPALIDSDLFERTQERLRCNRDRSPRNTRGEYLLRRLVSCQRCGLAYRIWTNGRSAFYACPGTPGDALRGHPEACRAPRIATHRLDAAVWEDLCQVLTDPTILAESLRRAQQGWLGDGPEAGRRQALQRREAEMHRQIERLVDAYAAGALRLEELQARRTRLDARLAELRREAEVLAAASQHDERVEALAQQLETFRAALAHSLATASFARRRELVELLIERVVVEAPEVEVRYHLPVGATVGHGELRSHHSTNVGRIHVLVHLSPVFHGPMDPPCPAPRMRGWFVAMATEDEGPGVGGIPDDLVDRSFGGCLPEEVTASRPGGLSARQQDTLIAQGAQHLLTGAQGAEAREDEIQRVLDAYVGVLDHPAVGQAHQSGGQPLAVAPTLHLPHAPGFQAEMQQVELGLAEHAPQPEQQPVVVGARIVDAIGIGDERPHDRGQIEQGVPIGVAPGEPAGLIAEDDPDMAEGDLGYHLLEARALAVLAGLAEVGVDHVDALRNPPQRSRALHQGVLIGLALSMVLDLVGRRLPDVDVGVPVAMAGGDLLSGRRHHGGPPG